MATRSIWLRKLLFALPLLALLLAFSDANALTCSAAASAGPNGTNEAAIYRNVCWIDLSGYVRGTSIAAAQTAQPQTLTLPDGSTFNFTIQLTLTAALTGGTCLNSTAKLTSTINTFALPTFNGASLGTADYIGVGGNPAFAINAPTPQGCPASNTTAGQYSASPTVTLSAMSLLNPDGSTGTFQFIAADAESTNKQIDGSLESLSFQTDGTNWIQIDKIAPSSASVLSVAGLNTATVSETNPTSNTNSQTYIFASNNPTTVTATLKLQGSQQAVAFGLTSGVVTLNKALAAPGRANASDQFVYKIANNTGTSPTGASQTTTGAGTTNSGALATITNVFGGSLTVSESMATGSVTPLGAYTSIYNCSSTVNPAITTTSGNTFALTNTSPFFTSTNVIGQIYACTFTNAPPANVSITKTDSNPTYTPGANSTYTITVSNGPTGIGVTGALVSDLLPKGITIAAPGVTCPTASGGATCSGTATNGTAGTVGTGSLNVLSGLTVNLPSGSSVTITIPVTYSNSAAAY